MKTKIWAAMLCVYIIWGSTYLAIRFAVETIPPFLMAGTRFLIAGMILYVWRKATGDQKPNKIEWRSAAVVGLLLLVGGNGNVVWAEQRVASGVTALLVGTAPIWFVLLDGVWPGGRKPSLQTIAGVLIGFFGIFVLIDPFHITSSAETFDPVGVIALLCAAVLWASGSLYSRGARLPNSPFLGTGMEMLIGGAGFMLLATLTGEWSRLDINAITPRSVWALVYLIVFGSLVALTSYTWLLRNAPTPLVSTYAYVNPLVAIFLGSLLANEPITPRIIISAVIVVGSVVLINTARMGSEQKKPSAEVTT